MLSPGRGEKVAIELPSMSETVRAWLATSHSDTELAKDII